MQSTVEFSPRRRHRSESITRQQMRKRQTSHAASRLPEEMPP
jgi:hypothetical protein